MVANVNAPNGLSVVSYKRGSKWTGAGTWYSIAAAYGTALAIGDPVDLSGTADAQGVPGIVLGAAGSPLVGVIVGGFSTKYGGAIGAAVDNMNKVILPASSAGVHYALVADDPDIIFEIQEISGGTQLAAVDVGLNVNGVAAANNGFISGWQLDNGTKGTSNAYNFKLLQLSNKPGNTFGAYAKWWVMINDHRYRAGVTGV